MIQARRLLRHCMATALACAVAPVLAGPVRNKPQPVAPVIVDQLRPGSGYAFRSLVPVDMLEQQAAQQYRYLLAGAQRDKRLLGATQAPLPQVRATVARLVPYALKWSDRSRQWHWETNIVRTPQIDAFCLPGGNILLTTGMLERLRLNENEIAMLLGHEIAHALRDHLRARLGERVAEQLAAHITPLGYGALPGLSGPPLAIGTQLLTLGYSRDDETEADVIGTEIAARAGYDPRAVFSLWAKLDKLNRSQHQPFLLARPYDDKRVTDMRKHMRDMLSLYARSLNTPIAQLRPYRDTGAAVVTPHRAVRRAPRPASAASAPVAASAATALTAAPASMAASSAAGAAGASAATDRIPGHPASSPAPASAAQAGAPALTSGAASAAASGPGAAP